MNTPTKIIVHHTNGVVSNYQADTSHHTAQDIDDWHRTRWPGFTSQVFRNKKGEPYHCGYHYVIEKDGTIVQTRAHSEEGAHCVGMNTSSIGVCLAGNFDVLAPTKEQTDAFISLWKKIKYEFPHLTPYDIVPHRKYSTKSCFGNMLPDDFFSGIVIHKMPVEQKLEERKTYDQRSFLQKKIELLTMIVAILTQKLTGKRMKL